MGTRSCAVCCCSDIFIPDQCRCAEIKASKRGRGRGRCLPAVHVNFAFIIRDLNNPRPE